MSHCCCGRYVSFISFPEVDGSMSMRGWRVVAEISSNAQKPRTGSAQLAIHRRG